ncbi:DUF4261 domain-containing protein [Stieleria sp. JC731]|uniref:DUF4261 domain-containing protein n=1 Tax=Pirellulaceae TaxID=2691357 RepID=UPI001E546ECC|nr:DUF4261 domain-containing protein [Stieleria sp. JC731]MCC9600410.1 DUF4261 domain-containing protein [Stieleria sp. JC731]
MTMVCFVVFSDAPQFDSRAFGEHMSGCFPDAIEIDSIKADSENIHQIDLVDKGEDGVDPGAIFVSRMPKIPTESDEESATPLWPDAQAQLASHQSHWVVVVGDSKNSPVTQAKILTQAVNAILNLYPTAVGILWGKQATKVSSENFRLVVDSMGKDDLPVGLWIDIDVVPHEGHPTMGLTTGLEAFGLMEIECVTATESAEELYARLTGVCEYLMLNGPVLKHGDSLGETEHERIRVLHRESVFGREGKVIHLVYEGSGENASLGPEDNAEPSLVQSLLVLLACVGAVGCLVIGIVYAVGWLGEQFADQPQPEQPRFAMRDDQSNPETETSAPTVPLPVQTTPLGQNQLAPQVPQDNDGPDRDESNSDMEDSNVNETAPLETDTVQPSVVAAESSNEATGAPQAEFETPATASEQSPSKVEVVEAADPPALEVEPSSGQSIPALENPFEVVQPSQVGAMARAKQPTSAEQDTLDQATEARQWHDASGDVLDSGDIFAVEKERDQTVVRVRMPDGTESSIAYKQLSSEDQTFAKQWYVEQRDAIFQPVIAKLPEVGDKVRVKWSSRWYDGTIKEIEGERYRFRYDGWGKQWDEWKTADRLRWPDDTPVAESQ